MFFEFIFDFYIRFNIEITKIFIIILLKYLFDEDILNNINDLIKINKF